MIRKLSRAPEPVPALRNSASSKTDTVSLKPDFVQWAKFVEWKGHEAAALLCGLDPEYASRTWSLYGSPTHYLPRDQQAQYAGLRKLAERTAPIEYHRGAPPVRWLAWAKKCGRPIPAELGAAIEKYEGSTASGELPDRRTSLASSESKCERWLIGEMRKSPDFRPQKKDTYFEQAKLLFKGLSGHGFCRAWANAVTDTGATAWSKAGKPPKS